jgi:hypothetical protein
MIKPNFFIVGKPKSGTTSLHYMLDQHPDIYMSPVKEPHHFHRDYIEEAEKRNSGYLGLPYKDRKDYLKLFEGAESEKIVGESSTGYLYSKRAAQEIAKFNPDAKILMVFREPVDFIHSLHSQFLRSGNENERDFRKALLLEESRKRGENIPPRTSFSKNLFYSEQGKYCEQVERFFRNFRKSQIKVSIYEDFRADNLSIYREILESLGINPDFKPKLMEANPNKKMRFLKLATWLVYHGDKKDGAIGQWAPNWFLKRVRPVLSGLFFKKIRREQLDPELRRELSVKFRSEVVVLSEIIGIDLVKKWGYENV